MPLSIQSQLIQAKNLLKKIDYLNHSDSPQIDAEVLLCFILKKNRAYLYSHPEKTLNPDQINLFNYLISERSKGQPIAYLTGTREFWSLDFCITPDVLIPRADTEILIQAVLDHAQNQNQALAIADFGTGSGIIAITLASERPHWKIIGLDISPQALKLARKNAEKNQIKNINFIESSWGEKLLPPLCPSISSVLNWAPASAGVTPPGERRKQYELLDVIVSNPPYLSQTDPHLSQGDLRFEPPGALISGKSGLEDFEKIIKQAKQLLKPDSGKIFFEHGFNQAQDIFNLLTQAGFKNIQTIQDLNKINRVTFAQN